MMAAMDGPRVALVSADLLFASRLRAALAGTVEVRLAGADEVPDEETVFVDLNADVDARLQLIARLRERAARVIGFCNHEERDVRVRAMACGADQVVTNGALQQAALRLLGVAGGA